VMDHAFVGEERWVDNDNWEEEEDSHDYDNAAVEYEYVHSHLIRWRIDDDDAVVSWDLFDGVIPSSHVPEEEDLNIHHHNVVHTEGHFGDTSWGLPVLPGEGSHIVRGCYSRSQDGGDDDSDGNEEEDLGRLHLSHRNE